MRSMGLTLTRSLPFWLQLQQAQEAFILGVPLAAVSQMRALAELVLTYHYGFVDGNISDKLKSQAQAKLKTNCIICVCLKRCSSLWRNSVTGRGLGGKRAEKRLPNRGVVGGSKKKTYPETPQFGSRRDLISYLLALQRLIEKAPLDRRACS